MEKTADTAFPLAEALAFASEVTVAERGYSPPTPIPKMKRQKVSWWNTEAPSPLMAVHVALPNAPTMTKEIVVMKMALRPNLSARAPKKSYMMQIMDNA